MKLFLLSFFLCLIFTPIVRQVAIKFNLLDQPSDNRWHKKPVALLGGVAIYLSIVISLLFNGFFLTPICFVGMTVLFVLGLIDDFMYIRPAIKILTQVMMAVYVIASGVHFWWFDYFILNALVSMVWIVGITNAFNLLDNMDGLCAGIGIMACFFFILIYFGVNNEGMTVSFILGGSLMAFLIYNAKPASIFMGDCGSLVIGFLFSVLGLYLSFSHGFDRLDSLALLILAIPILDTSFVTIKRLVSGRSVFIGGKDHLSHMLVSVGFSEMASVMILIAGGICFGLLGLIIL